MYPKKKKNHSTLPTVKHYGAHLNAHANDLTVDNQ